MWLFLLLFCGFCLDLRWNWLTCAGFVTSRSCYRSGLTRLGLNFCPESNKSMSARVSLSSFRLRVRVVAPRAPLPLAPRGHGGDRWAATGERRQVRVCPGRRQMLGRSDAKAGLHSSLVIRVEPGQTGGTGRRVGSEGDGAMRRPERGNWRRSGSKEPEWWEKPLLVSHDSPRNSLTQKVNEPVLLQSLFSARTGTCIWSPKCATL